MNDYPNNETLIAVINAIDETKADKIELNNYVTKEEYAAGGSNNSNQGSAEEIITTEYTYTYDGNTNSEDHT